MSGANLPLYGRRILVAEDEYMIAQEIAAVLDGAGAEILGPVPKLAAAARLVASEAQIDGALLDVNLGREAVWPVVDSLLARNIPVLLATGYDATAIPSRYAGLPRCEKPATGPDLVRSLVRALDERRPAPTRTGLI